MSSKDSAYSGSRSFKPSATRPARANHIRQHAEHSSERGSSENSKRDTEHYLQYYQSSIADGQDDDETDRESSSTHLTRQTSDGSTSPSDYSDSHANEFSTTAPLSISNKARRRSKAPSDGSSDRRRLAIVQMDALDDSPPRKYKEKLPRSTSIRTRRGVATDLAGLALVAPPDAAPKSYSHLTPPITAPTTADTIIRQDTRANQDTTASDVTKIIRPTVPYPSGTQSASTSKETHVGARVTVDSNALTSLGDHQCRPSRSPSPGVVPDASHQAPGLLSPTSQAQPATARGGSLITTPEIGEKKDIGARVAAPVVINLESASPFRRNDPSSRNESLVQPASAMPKSSQDRTSYLHYEPGIDATAGPLPTLPPPRAMFNIDLNSPAPPRPPRLNSPFSARSRGDIEAVKQALQLPPSVASALASRMPRSTTQDYSESPETKKMSLDGSHSGGEISTNTSELCDVRPVHRREGAFSPSPPTLAMKTPGSDALAFSMASSTEVEPVDRLHGDVESVGGTKPVDDLASGADDVPPITVIQPMQLIEEQDDQEDNDVSTDMISSPATRRRTSEEMTSRSGSQSPLHGHHGETPSPPPKSFRNSLTSNFKRLSSSLPRTPSLSSKSRRSSDTYYSSRTPSPSMHVIPLPSVLPKIKSAYPPAMFYAEISSKRTSLERCTLYAQKINELYMYDSGLSDWTVETRLRVHHERAAVTFSSHAFTPQPRHTSRSSMISEVTFPRRPDASTATDLTIKTHDLTPAAPPALPYPSLANQHMYPARSSSLASNTPPNSIRSLAPSTPSSKSSGGFFASLGRKASMSSSKKPGLPQLSTTAPTRVLTKQPPASAAPRVINISNSPVVPGGPRAIPNHRGVRSQTLMVTANSFSSNASTAERNEALGRRPSLFDLTSSPEPVIDIVADPEFVRQVDKLIHLLPDADRDVLAGYLRRAGQDILAIGQYLEDEKNGAIKPP